MTSKYNKFKCFWAAVTEKKHQKVSIERDRPSQILNEKSAFSPGTVVFEKYKTITNQERIGCLVYPEITQISERSL